MEIEFCPSFCPPIMCNIKKEEEWETSSNDLKVRFPDNQSCIQILLGV